MNNKGGVSSEKVFKRDLKRELSKTKSQEDTEPMNKRLKLDSEKLNSMIETQNLNLECPVCFNLPRPGPIYGCRNGHHVCQRCQKSIKNCPICRDPDVKCRQLMLEAMLKGISNRDGFKIKCKHDHCNVEGSLENIGEHENLCVAREIICPMSFRGVCQFKGNLRDFLRHIKTTKCCQMLLYPGWKRDGDINEPFEKESVFTSHVGDNKEGMSVLERKAGNGQSGETVWKPTLFLSKKILTAGMGCLFINRHGDGTWSLIVQSLVPKEVIQNWSVTIEVTDAKNETAPVYTFKGKPISQELTSKDAYATGQYLSLHDNQIKNFRKSDTNHLFDYKVKFELDKEFEDKCLNIVNGQF